MDTPLSTLEFRLTPSEYRRLVRRLQLRRWSVVVLFAGFALAYLALGASEFTLRSILRGLIGYLPYITGLGAMALWLFVVTPWLAAKQRISQGLYQKQCYHFDERGVTVAMEDGSRYRRPVGSIIGAELVSGFLLLRQDNGLLFAVPRGAFADEEGVNAVLAHFGGADDETDGGGEGERYTLAEGVAMNLRAGVRLMAFRPMRAGDFAVGVEHLLLLVVMTLALSIGSAYLLMEGAVEFSAYRLQEDGFSLLLMLVGGYLVMRGRGRVAALPLFLVAVMSVGPLFAVIGAFLDQGRVLGGEALEWIFYLVIFLWIIAVYWRSARLALDTGPVATSASLLLFFSVALLPLFWLPESYYWYATDEGQPATPRVNMEELFYRQPGLVGERVAALREERPGVADLYHIGFGGYASQQVFRRELNHVRGVLDGRFDTAGRSLLMINDPESSVDTPIASASNLRLALADLGRRMNPEEDLLFLYLTSHGSRTAELTLEFRPLELNPLTAFDLREMLDEAGIQRRVVVISACYSGSFMNQLKDEHTLVITAASPFRTSFGCGNEFEYTYFGEAYFKQALAETRSFTKAFELARERVAERELKEGIEASEPMIYVGEAIGPYLERLETRLAVVEDSSPPVGEVGCVGAVACDGGRGE